MDGNRLAITDQDIQRGMGQLYYELIGRDKQIAALQQALREAAERINELVEKNKKGKA